MGSANTLCLTYSQLRPVWFRIIIIVEEISSPCKIIVLKDPTSGHPYIIINTCPHLSTFHLADSPFERSASTPKSSGEIERQISSSICEICCEGPRDTVLTCGHQFCNACSQKVDNCPICRKLIQHRIQKFN